MKVQYRDKSLGKSFLVFFTNNSQDHLICFIYSSLSLSFHLFLLQQQKCLTFFVAVLSDSFSATVITTFVLSVLLKYAVIFFNAPNHVGQVWALQNVVGFLFCFLYLFFSLDRVSLQSPLD